MSGSASGLTSGRPATGRDRRLTGLLLMSVGVVLIGLLISHAPSPQELHRLWLDLFPQQPQAVVAMQQPPLPATLADAEPVARQQSLDKLVPSDPLRQRLDMHFQRAVMMLHAKEYAHTLVALQQVLAIAPQMPEAYVNSGFALIGLERFAEAKQAFLFAIDLRPEQANAYYGLAVALDALQDRMGAMGAMYSYLHRADADDPFRRKAAAAVWEWEAERKQGSSGASPHGVQAVVTNQQQG